MLNVQIISLKRQGKENVKHKPVIEKEDLAKLIASRAIAVTKCVKCVVSCCPVFLLERKRRAKGAQKIEF